MLGGILVKSTSLTRWSISPGEEESNACETALSMPQVVAITLLGDLAIGDAVDDNGHVGHLAAARRNAHKLASIVGSAHDEASHHLVACGYLVLDEYAGVGDGGRQLGGRPFYAFGA